jgi:hypothetical protein
MSIAFLVANSRMFFVRPKNVEVSYLQERSSQAAQDRIAGCQTNIDAPDLEPAQFRVKTFSREPLSQTRSKNRKARRGRRCAGLPETDRQPGGGGVASPIEWRWEEECALR